MNHEHGVSVSDCRSLKGLKVFFFGKLESMSRREAKVLVEQSGGFVTDRFDDTVALVVVGADQVPIEFESESDFDLLDEAILQSADQEPIVIISELQFFQELGLLEPETSCGQLYTAAMLADLLSVPLATIRRWHRRGLIHPIRQIKKLAYFDFQEVSSARRIARLIESGESAETIERKLSRLAKLYPDMQRPLAQLSIIVEGKEVLLRNDRGLVEPGGQLRLNFDQVEDDIAHTAIRIHPPFENDSHWNSVAIPKLPDSGHAAEDRVLKNRNLTDRDLNNLVSPEEFLQLATELEDQMQIDSAIEVYRAMSLAFGPSADICFRVAELLYQANDLAGARERYYLAIELDETFVEARASLGCVLTELGQPDLAYSAFTGALAHHSDYPDVHFHLARLLDELEREFEAQHHWQQFLKLAPKSPWAAEARQRLEDSDWANGN